jgi:hypothetical protein
MPSDAEGEPAGAETSEGESSMSKFKKNVSVPGMIGLALMLTGAALCITACVSLPWRIGAGSADSLYAGLLGPDFTQREYYMYYVKGVQKRSWHDLTVLTCDRAAKVEITIGSQDDGICDTALAAQLPEKCSHNFLPHVKDRCHVYNFVMAMNGAFCIISFVDAGIAIIIGALGVAPILKGMKKFYLPLTLSLAFSAMAQLGAWMYFTDEKFTFIGRNAEFPYPGVATGFWVYFGGTLAYMFAAFCYFSDWKNASAGGGGEDDKEEDKKSDTPTQDI